MWRYFASVSRRVSMGCLLSALALPGCGATAVTGREPSEQARAGLASYLREVEPIRLGVNRLLEEADPILVAFHQRRTTARQAAAAMDRLEYRFAAYAVDVQAIRPRLPALASLHAQYAHTYILEDAYLSALVAGLANGSLDSLPNTQAAQRAAIIAWRTGLAVLARRAGTELPADLQQAGRGEIAPNPMGS
jgi:hypothetical protein